MKEHIGRQPRRFGPGTLLAVAGAALLLASGWMAQPALNAGQVAYEADGHGGMRRVETPSRQSPAPLPLPWKPEPQLLLDRASSLRLTWTQRQQMETVQSAWQRDKQTLQREMEYATSPVTDQLQPDQPHRSVSLSTLQQGLSDYSELSREYNARRSAAWTQALSLLTPAQRAVLRSKK